MRAWGWGEETQMSEAKHFHEGCVFYFLCPPCSQWSWSQWAKERRGSALQGSVSTQQPMRRLWPLVSSKLISLPPTPSLLRYDSCIIQFTHLKHTVQWLVIYSQLCAAITAINLGMFVSSAKETCKPLAVLLQFPPAPPPAQGKH